MEGIATEGRSEQNAVSFEETVRTTNETGMWAFRVKRHKHCLILLWPIISDIGSISKMMHRGWLQLASKTSSRARKNQNCSCLFRSCTSFDFKMDHYICKRHFCWYLMLKCLFMWSRFPRIDVILNGFLTSSQNYLVYAS